MMTIKAISYHRNDSPALPTPTSSTKASKFSQHGTQVLVRLNNEKTHVLQFPSICGRSNPIRHGPTSEEIIQKLSFVTKIPSRMLRLNPSDTFPTETCSGQSTTTTHVKFLSASTFLPIRGGKGGFGTLLKGQSKQAGARRTTDFGACRDLNGRRLRHVNDEIKLRVWRESMNRRMRKSSKNGGVIDVEKEIEELRTASGIRNWHLMTPSWGAGEMSGKARRKEDIKLRREIERYARQQKISIEKQMEKKRAWDQTIKDYAFVTQQSLAEQDVKMSKSILEGMKKRRKIEIHKATGGGGIDGDADNDGNSDEIDDVAKSTSLLSSSILCTLSGDVVIEDEDGKTKHTMIQSKSEFATIAVLINSSKFDPKRYNGIYYEIVVESAGIAQVGWAKIIVPSEESTSNIVASCDTKDGFQPNSETGDGVGDDSFSFGFDGQRHLCFHDGKETPYGSDTNEWKKGDVIGCMYDTDSGDISFSVNGTDLGTAFKYSPPTTSTSQLLYPVFSLNENEVVSLNIGPTFSHCPKDKLGIFDLVNMEGLVSPSQIDGKPIADSTQNLSKDFKSKKASSDDGCESSVDTEPLDLDTYNSPQELESVGMSRLKEELYKRGLKCGGNLKERASRLFAIKGLSREDIPRKLRGKNF